MGSQQGDDLQLNGDLACENAEVRGQLLVAGVPITPTASAARYVTGDPNGVVSATLGTIAVDILTGTWWQNIDGVTDWSRVLETPAAFKGFVRISVAPSPTAHHWIDMEPGDPAHALVTTLLYLRERDTNHTAAQALVLVADQQATFDTTGGAASARGFESTVSSSRVAGANPLTNLAIVANAILGDQNFSFFSSNGIFRNDGLTVWGTGDGGPTALTQLTMGGLATVQEFQGTAISPAALAGANDNYNPPGLSTATSVYLSASAPFTITGMRGERDQRYLDLINTSAEIGTFPALDAGSVGAAQWLTAFTLNPGQIARVLYDGRSGPAVNKWRLVSLSP